MTFTIIANFGGPRSLDELEPFLVALLTDPNVIKTPLPNWLQNIFFRRIAKKRAPKVAPEYEAIGGKSPLYFDTEAIAKALGENVICFHRYLPATHREFIEKVEAFEGETIRVFSMFPQFSYATTGSIAKFFSKFLSKKTVAKIQWISSYADHPIYISLCVEQIRRAMQGLKEEETLFIYTPHGLPAKFIEEGDPYRKECETSFDLIRSHFPKGKALLSFQSRFGRQVWIQPYTEDICKEIKCYAGDKKNVVFFPLSFTSDHYETLFEIEKLYCAEVEKQGYKAVRIPAFNQSKQWIAAIAQLLESREGKLNSELLQSAVS